MDKKLVIITGASGRLGNAYLDYFATKCEFDVVAISRSDEYQGKLTITTITADLLDQKRVSEEIRKIDFEKYKKVYLIHPVGKFKFQKNGTPEFDDDNDGIDDEVLHSNVVTLENILTSIMGRLKGTRIAITVCAFGSISDRYNIPFWSSYSRSKNILRSILRDLTKKTISKHNISALFVNVSSVDTGNENKLRPQADKKYWLKPEKIAQDSLLQLLDEGFSGYNEIDIYNPVPNFDVNYFQNNEYILRKWLKEMG
jgi:short-subunit dehydrogenase